MMKFSLIIGTLHRPKELAICLNSLMVQSYQNFEILIIDQSDDNKTQQLIQEKKYALLDIKYFHKTFKSLSKARNHGLREMSGDYFCLIDDDAVYCKDYLKNINKAVKSNLKVIVCGFIYAIDTNRCLSDYERAKNKSFLSIRQIIRMCPSAGLTFPKQLFEEIGEFDTDFGVGERYGACEETDYILRSLKLGYKVFYIKEARLDHPVVLTHSKKLVNYKKFKNYAVGFGALMKKHCNTEYKNILLLNFYEKIIKLLIKKTGIMGRKKKLIAKAEWEGLFIGWKEYKRTI